MAVFTILYGNYYPPHGEFELICIGKFARRTWVNFAQQYRKNRQRCQQNTFTMLYGNYCYISLESSLRARTHVSKPVKTYLKNIKWGVLPHARLSSFWLLFISIDAAWTFRTALQFLRRGQELNRRMVSFKWRTVVLERNPPVTKKMEKSHR